MHEQPPPSDFPDVTAALVQFGLGNPAARSFLLNALYADLHRIAEILMNREAPGHSLQPTALIHEAYLKLVGGQQPDWQGRTHFLSTAARDMRLILVDHARKKKAEKRGGSLVRVTLSDQSLSWNMDVDLLDLHEAMERFARDYERQAKVVDLRYFAGLTVEETAEALGVSSGTIKLDARFALAWLFRALSGHAATSSGQAGTDAPR